MGSYVKVLNGIVVDSIKAEPDFFKTFQDTSPGEWIQTSYNTRGGIHYGDDGKPDGGVALRGNFAGIGMIYDSKHDVFYHPQPWPSWTLDTNTWSWQPPAPWPEDPNQPWVWDESTKSWKLEEVK